MHILFITDNFPPETNAPATRTYEHCKYWISKGHKVTVITCAPNFPIGKVYEGYKNNLIQKEDIDGINVIRVWSYISANKRFVRRTLDFMSFAMSSFFGGLFVKNVDVIVATSPQFFTTISGYLLSIFKRKPWVFELRDIWPESIKAVSPGLANSRLLVEFEKLEKMLYRKSDLIISVTDAFKRNLISRGSDGDKIGIVKNGANLSLYQPREKDQSLIDQYKLNDKFVIGYIGTHGLAHKLDIFLDYAKNTAEKDVQFVFIGAGAEKGTLVRTAKKMELDNVLFLDSIKKEEIPAHLSIMDVALVPLRKSELFKTVIPSKIFETASMNIPILLGVEGESKEIIETYHAGLCFEPESLEDFDIKLKELKNNKEEYRACQEGGKKLAVDFDRNKMAEKMENYLLDLIS